MGGTQNNPSAVANPGSALGEAIGALLESEIHRILKPLAEGHGCIYLTTGGTNPKTGGARKLILTDSDGNEFNIDSVIINNRLQPLILVESKYIRYTKHNRDKASWICTAHTKLRQRYSTVRRSIAVIMGSWSEPSKRLMGSFEVELFEIPFDNICDVLEAYGIDYRWKEKARDHAMESWLNFNELSEGDKRRIAKELISIVEEELRQALEIALTDGVPRKLSSITLLVRSNLGETHQHIFSDLDKALKFMEEFDEETDMDAASNSAPTLLEEKKTSVDESEQDLF